MEKAILKTLIYSDIFNYPLKGYEIHKWLIGRKISFQKFEKALDKLIKKNKIKNKKGYLFLKGREGVVLKRLQKEKQSKKYFLKAKVCSLFLKIVPSLKLVGISGGLALNNASKSDDIDLFLVTSKNRLWLTRLLVILILDLLGVRRKASMNKSKVGGKICLNILLEEDRLEQQKKDLFVSHEVLQMKVLWQRGNTYKKYLEDNEWVFKFLPNWIGPSISEEDRLSLGSKGNKKPQPNQSPINLLEHLSKRFQTWYMKKPQGMERILDGALYFHPNDVREKVLKEFKQKTKRL